MYITFMTSSECDHGLLWLFKHCSTGQIRRHLQWKAKAFLVMRALRELKEVSPLRDSVVLFSASKYGFECGND